MRGAPPESRSSAAVRTRTGVVLEVQDHAPGAMLLRVEMDEPDDARGPEVALTYTDLVGIPSVGDRVLLNTTAGELGLGTGGYHFVIAILNPNCVAPPASLSGHLMKLRYTPHQCAVLAAEEEGSPHRAALEQDELDGAPVVTCELHSQVAAVAAGFLARRPGARVIYVMTSGAALPLAFSTLVPRLREAGLIHGAITAGQCFGGDLEAINVYTGLLLARHALGADLVITGQGPGNAGTGTAFGFSGIEQGEAANAAASLGGRAIVCLRASAADLRERHGTPSHHTLTILDRVARCRCLVAIARDAPGSRRRRILEVLQSLQLDERHDLLLEHRGTPGLEVLASAGVPVTTMGRSVAEDREFFLHAAAAGDAAAWLLEMRA